MICTSINQVMKQGMFKPMYRCDHDAACPVAWLQSTTLPQTST